MKSDNPQYLELYEVNLQAVFEDLDDVFDLGAEDDEDIMDSVFPIDSYLEAPLIQYVVQELSNAKYQAEDDINNAHDDLGEIANYVAQHIKKRQEASQ